MSLNNHHAYLLICSWDSEALTRELLSQLEIKVENNPDLVVHSGSFGIDEARALGERVSTRPFGEKRVIVIDASEMTKEAQNALLKTLEEPGEGNVFFLVAPYEDRLLPSLRSRLELVRENHSDSSHSDSPEKFLKLTPSKRLDFAKKFKDDEKRLGPFLDALLARLKEEGRVEDMKKVFDLRRYADDTSADSRMILEHLGLIL